MAQTWTDDVFAGTHNGQTDLQNMENNFQALKSLFSGAAAPASVVGGMPWYDTGKNVLKTRNGANSAWYGQMHGDVNQKLWVYRNTAMAGWVVDSSVSDRVLVAKGGSTYATGGVLAGSWVISGLSVPAHKHLAGTLQTPALTHISQGRDLGVVATATTFQHDPAPVTGSTADATIAAVSSAGTWRPAAAVNTLQRLNI